MIGPVEGIDHVILGTGDLEAARAAWARLGFTISPRGRHKGWGTGNYCIMLEKDYLELLGMVDPAGFDNGLAAMLAKQGDGLLGFALATQDADAAAAWLASRGRPHERKDLGRLLELPEGTVELKFALAMPKDAWPGGIRPFVTGHLMRDAVWRPEWTAHANTACAIQSLTCVVDDPLSLVDAYERVFGLGTAVPTDDTLAVRWGRGAGLVLFAKPADFTFLHPAVGPDEPVRAGLAGMTLLVRSLDACASALKAGGVDFDRDRTAALHLPPEEAGGVALSFVEA
ncbi:MAG: VOC family protein [Rhodospirillales bacterium]|nr:VOC family protein [Rhodospirillales bacterium]